MVEIEFSTKRSIKLNSFITTQQHNTTLKIISQDTNELENIYLPDRELNHGLPRDRRGY